VSTAPAPTAGLNPTRISSSTLGFSWCVRKPVALGSSTPPGGSSRRAGKKTEGELERSASRYDDIDEDARGTGGSEASTTGVGNGDRRKKNFAPPNAARDLAESLSAFGTVPFSPRKGCENTGECRSGFKVASAKLEKHSRVSGPTVSPSPTGTYCRFQV